MMLLAAVWRVFQSEEHAQMLTLDIGLFLSLSMNLVQYFALAGCSQTTFLGNAAGRCC